MTDLLERIITKVVKQPTGCWEWSGDKTSSGYGRLTVRGKKIGAHRVSYEAHVGPIPQGLEIDHLCRNRACVNPAHLEPVTHTENVRRGAKCKWTETHCGNGHEITPEIVVWRPNGHRECLSCRKEAGKRSSAKHNLNRRPAPFRPNQSGLRGVVVLRSSPNTPLRYLAKLGARETVWRGPRRLNAIQAAFDYDDKAHDRHGSRARLNFPCRFGGVGR